MPGRRAEPWRLPALCGKTHSQLDARLGARKGALPHHGWQAGLTQASPRFVSRSLCWVHAQAGMVREEENLISVSKPILQMGSRRAEAQNKWCQSGVDQAGVASAPAYGNLLRFSLPGS